MNFMNLYRFLLSTLRALSSLVVGGHEGLAVAEVADGAVPLDQLDGQQFLVLGLVLFAVHLGNLHALRVDRLLRLRAVDLDAIAVDVGLNFASLGGCPGIRLVDDIIEEDGLVLRVDGKHLQHRRAVRWLNRGRRYGGGGGCFLCRFGRRDFRGGGGGGAHFRSRGGKGRNVGGWLLGSRSTVQASTTVKVTLKIVNY